MAWLPAIAPAGNSAIIADIELISSGNRTLWYATQPDSTTWNLQAADANTTAGDGDSSPAITWTGSSVVVAADTPGGGLSVWSQPSGGTTWTRQFGI